MKKAIIMALTLTLACSLCLGLGAAFAQEQPLSSPANLVKELADGELLPGYQVDGKTNLPFPDDWSIKAGKVGGAVTFVNNDGTVRTAASGIFFASEMPLTAALTSEVTEYTVSAKVTPKERGDWGGVGILIGWHNEAPVVLFLTENPSMSFAIDGNEWAKAFEPMDGVALPAFALDTEYDMKVAMKDGIASVYLNGTLINNIDLSAYEITPAVGPAMKNYRGEYTDFALEAVVPMKEPAAYADYDNIVADTVGLLDTYGVSAEFKTQQPFPSDWGMKVSVVEGAYMRVDNNMNPYINASFCASYLPTMKDVSSVTDYYVEATVTPAERNNWGGAGIVVGRGAEDGAPVVIWMSEVGGVYVAYSFEEFRIPVVDPAVDEPMTFETGTPIRFGAVVTGGQVAVYIDGALVGTADISAAQSLPAVGTAFKNWNAEITEIAFRTDTEGLENAKYTIYGISGAVEISDQEYTYGEKVSLNPAERKGYQFMGWHLLPDLSDQVVTEIPAGVGGDINLYCEFATAVYSIKYYDGDTEMTDPTFTANYDFKSYIPLPTPAKEGYTFEGWYESADFSGEKVEAIEMGTTGDKVFYAKFVREGGGSGDETDGCGSALGISSALLCAAAAGAGLMLLRKKRGAR